MHGELTHEQVENVLRSELTGRIGCHDEERTYVIPVSYAYDGTDVYARSREGLKIRTMRDNPSVCFEVEQIDDLANWRTVLAWGAFEELEGVEARRASRRLDERFQPYVTSETAEPLGGPRTWDDPSDVLPHRSIIYRIRLSEKTGRFERR